MKIIFTESAKKDWQRLDTSVRRQLKTKLAFYRRAEQALRFAEKLRDFDSGEYRFRVGDRRIIFDVRGDIIFILRIGNRKDVYR